jgi:geranyl-CoA carboxylase alpha subunit
MALQCGEQLRHMRLQPDRHGGVAITLRAEAESSDAQCAVVANASAAPVSQPIQASVLRFAAGQLRFVLDGVAQSAVALRRGVQLHLALDGECFVFLEPSAFPAAHSAQDPGRARAPVAGRVSRLLVAVGDPVVVGQQLLCVEAMKMEMWLCAQAPGTVGALHVQAGDQVESGALLVELSVAPHAAAQ